MLYSKQNKKKQNITRIRHRSSIFKTLADISFNSVSIYLMRYTRMSSCHLNISFISQIFYDPFYFVIIHVYICTLEREIPSKTDYIGLL